MRTGHVRFLILQGKLIRIFWEIAIWYLHN